MEDHRVGGGNAQDQRDGSRNQSRRHAIEQVGTEASLNREQKLIEPRLEEQYGRNTNRRDFCLKSGQCHPEDGKDQQKNHDVAQGCPCEGGPLASSFRSHELAPFLCCPLSHESQHAPGGKNCYYYPYNAKRCRLSDLKRAQCRSVGVVR